MAARRPRLSSEETKNRLIDAGTASLYNSGLSIGLDAVNLEQAVRDSEVSRSSAYAVWSSEEFSPQEEFQREVLVRAIEERKETLVELGKTVGSLYPTLVGTLPRRELMREMIRITAKDNVEATSQSMGWRLVIALRAILHSAPAHERDETLSRWLNVSSQDLREYTIEHLYRPLAEAFAIQPRPRYGEKAYALAEICASAVSEGFSLRYWLDMSPLLDDLLHPTEEDGEANWSMYALFFEQIVEMFFIPIEGTWDEF